MAEKKTAKKDRYIRICPKCGSTDVHVDFSNPAVWAYGTRSMYKCGSCGHLGEVFPELLESEVNNYKEELSKEIKEGAIHISKEERVDANTAVFAIEAWLVILPGVFGIIIFITGIIKKSTIGILIGIALISLFILFYWLLKKGKF